MPCHSPGMSGLFVFNGREGHHGESGLMTAKAAAEQAWAEAVRCCHPSPADVRMAEELGFKHHSLTANIPSPQQPWKAPVAQWVRESGTGTIGTRDCRHE